MKFDDWLDFGEQCRRRKREEVNDPQEAMREAIVNALAHRDYEDATRHVIVEVFKNRIEVSSPGGPPSNAKMAVINRGTAKSGARNPLIAQGLRFMEIMEERGTGILRMKASMLAHGLDEPQLAIEDDYFVVTRPVLESRDKEFKLHAGIEANCSYPFANEVRTKLNRSLASTVRAIGFVRDLLSNCALVG